MKSVCIITSIFPPTSAVKTFVECAEFNKIIVVGDRKSPTHYPLDGVRFIPIDEQDKMAWITAKSLPRDHYARKMLGYLEAAAFGADVMFDTDDDNRLIAGRSASIWRTPCNHEIAHAGKKTRFVNVYSHFTNQFIWPRGFPLDSILDPEACSFQAAGTSAPVPVGIWQGLADGDPDVDAIYRLTLNKACTFDMAPAIALAPGVVCPFNSQNTAFQGRLLPLMYLPAFVSFRYTDILRSLVAQPILWAAGLRLCFTAATVFQDRNIHDYIKDFESELPMYLTVRRAFEAVCSSIDEENSVSDNLYASYSALERDQIVSPQELTLLEAWLKDCEVISTNVNI